MRFGESAVPEEQRTDTPQTYRAFNSLMVFDDAGGLASVYDKTHLVPFGEYLPLQPLLESIGLEQLTRLRGGFTEGPAGQPLDHGRRTASRRRAHLLRSDFPGLIVGQKPQLLINVTNDGWFGNTTGPRATLPSGANAGCEFGVPLVRAANNGISALVDPYGRVVAKLNLNERGVMDVQVPAVHPRHCMHFMAIGFLH